MKTYEMQGPATKKQEAQKNTKKLRHRPSVINCPPRPQAQASWGSFKHPPAPKFSDTCLLLPSVPPW